MLKLRVAAVSVALGVAVSSAVVLASPASAAVPAVMTLSPPAAVFGQAVSATVVIDSGDVPPGVLVNFSIDAASYQQVTADSNGRASVNLPTSLAAGSHSVDATFLVFSDSGTAHADLIVTPAGSDIAVNVEPTQLVADATAKAPGSGTPGGTVQFAVGGASVGSAPLVDGLAKLPYTLAPGDERPVTVSYPGSSEFGPSTDATSRRDPLLRTTTYSLSRQSRSGWYAGPVTVSFTCIEQGAALVNACPEDVKLKRSAQDQSVTGTILAADGGGATATVSGIDIDSVKPVIVRATRSGCTAKDALSGVRKCVVKRTPGGLVAFATDKAGNVATRRV